jgi:hypothetical protein
MTTSSIPVAAFRFASDSRDARKDVGSFQQVLNGLNKTSLKDLDFSVQGIATQLGKLAPALSVGAVVAYTANATRAALATNDMAERLQLAASSFSRVQSAMRDAGVSVGGIETGIRAYQNTLSEALRGNAAAVKSFQAVNLTASQLKNLKFEEQLAIIADNFANTVAPVDRTRVAMDLFGQTGTELIPLLLKGAAGVRELTDAAVALDDRAVKALDRSAKAWEQFKQSASTGTANFLGDVIDKIGLLTGIIGADLALMLKVTEEQLKLEQSLAGGGTERAVAIRAARIADLEREVALLQRRVELEGRDPTQDSRLGGPAKISRAGLDQVRAAGLANEKEQERQRAVEAKEAARRTADDRVYFSELASKRIAETDRNIVEANRRSQEELTASLVDQYKIRTDAFVEQKGVEIAVEFSVGDILADLVGERFAYQVDMEKLKNQSLMQSATQLAGAYLQENKKYAKAAKAIALAQTAWATYKGIMEASPNFYLMALVGAAGALNIAKINSTNYNESGGGVGSVSAGSIPSGAALAPNVDSRIQDQVASAERSSAQIIIQGNVFNTRETADYLREVMEDLFDRDVVLISQNSAQAQALMPA